MLNLALVEDDPNEISVLKENIERYAKEKQVSFKITVFQKAEDFLALDSSSFDLLFMDIDLPGINGMEACRELRKKNAQIMIIFVTNLPQYAISGYEVDALDFIVKPVVYDHLAMKLDKAVDKAISAQEDKLEVMIDRARILINIPEVSYVEVWDHKVVFHLKDKTYETRGSLSLYEERFVAKNFFRVSVYCLVNLAAVSGVDRDEILLGSSRVRLSRSKKKDFLETLSNYLGRN
jgi:DNA-binding LytR/AlgR family response regulator